MHRNEYAITADERTNARQCALDVRITSSFSRFAVRSSLASCLQNRVLLLDFALFAFGLFFFLFINSFTDRLTLERKFLSTFSVRTAYLWTNCVCAWMFIWYFPWITQIHVVDDAAVRWPARCEMLTSEDRSQKKKKKNKEKTSTTVCRIHRATSAM